MAAIDKIIANFREMERSVAFFHITDFNQPEFIKNREKAWIH
jgi:hypothetical protein